MAAVPPPQADSGLSVGSTSPAALDAPEQQVSGPLSGPAAGHPPLPLTVGVAMRPRLRHLMAPEWRQLHLRHGGSGTTQHLDLVLLEVYRQEVPGWEGQHGDLQALVDRWLLAGTPVAAWVTAGPATGLGWLERITTVAASTEELRETVRTQTSRTADGGVLLLPAAAQPRVHHPAGPVGGRTGAVVVVDGFAALADDVPLTSVLAPAIDPMASDDVRLWRVSGKSSKVTMPTGLAQRVARTDDWADLEPLLGRPRVAVDLSGSAEHAAWTSSALAAAGTPMVGLTTIQGGLPEQIEALVPRVAEAAQLRSELVARLSQEELVAREGHLLQRAVLAGNTAGHRAQQLLTASGVRCPASQRSVSAVIPTNRPHEIDNILTNVGRQTLQDRELVLVLHGVDIPEAEIRSQASDAGVDNLVVVPADPTLTLGACMNLGVDAASGRYVAKMDDDNFYGAHYLADLVDAFSYTSAGIVGKWCHYVWLRSSGAVVLRYPDSEHRPERRIQGGSMVFDAEVVRQLRFADLPRAVDSDILDRAGELDVGIYSADRFNFVSVRGNDRLAHTWTVADATFMTKTGRLQFYGDPREHVSV